mmetsp:Transcript_32624/g.75096  ORF Transcript_32624/g.75096 Transcript_32624/m.75096 type:complete len:111 (+) Transcript_32624:1828-2160(+)
MCGDGFAESKLGIGVGIERGSSRGRTSSGVCEDSFEGNGTCLLVEIDEKRGVSEVGIKVLKLFGFIYGSCDDNKDGMYEVCVLLNELFSFEDNSTNILLFGAYAYAFKGS